jgi:hypothetical protein
MVRIDWTVLCDSAFLDNKDRLCIIGIIRRFPVASLPMTLPEVMLVARLADIRPVDDVAITAGVVFPSGRHAARMGSNDVVIEMAGEYILTRLRGISLSEEGLYRFQIQLRGQPVTSVEIPVLATCRAGFAEVQ